MRAVSMLKGTPKGIKIAPPMKASKKKQVEDIKDRYDIGYRKYGSLILLSNFSGLLNLSR